MPRWLYKILKRCHIVDECPNCASAWTGGHNSPETLTHCMVCGDKEGKITGWVWGRLVDPFYWLGHRTVARNFNYYKSHEKEWNNGD